MNCDLCKALIDPPQFQAIYNSNGVFTLYCSSCYYKSFLDNAQDPAYVVPPEHARDCECGSGAVGSQNHSNWCPKFKSEN